MLFSICQKLRSFKTELSEKSERLRDYIVQGCDSTERYRFTNYYVINVYVRTQSQSCQSTDIWSETEDCIYSVVDPKSTALFTKQLLDLERCKHKCLVEICVYSDVDPKLTALFTKQLLDPERCKHKCLVEICFYSVADPNLYLDQK